ncbi:MAG: WG repeat-containing protein [Aureispira sp.]|nr:WG repeat-containing protein [Aureispira sp.]
MFNYNIKEGMYLHYNFGLFLFISLTLSSEIFAQQNTQLYKAVGELKVIYTTTSSGKQYGITDKLDNPISEIKYSTPPRIEKFRSYHLKLCKVSILDKNGKTLYGLIDRNGQEVLDCKYDDISDKLDYPYIPVQQDDKYGIINQSCELVAPLVYDKISFMYPVDTKGYVSKFCIEIKP